jgi:hypothetical protein
MTKVYAGPTFEELTMTEMEAIQGSGDVPGFFGKVQLGL